MTRTGLSPTLSQHRREALLEVHPEDAAAHGLAAGGLARITTAAGSAVFRVAVSDGQRRGDLCVPMHWTDTMSGEGRANLLSLAEADPVSGQPGFKDTPASIAPVEPQCRAFLVCREEPTLPALVWWSRSRVRSGWLYEMAGDEPIDLDVLLPAGHRLVASDMVKGMRRTVVLDTGGELAAALYVTRSGELPPRDWVVGQLGMAGSASLELLAGRPAVPGADRGAIVCVCHGIGANEIDTAACGGAMTVDAIGTATLAGTNCGSCRPAIARLLVECLAQPREAAE